MSLLNRILSFNFFSFLSLSFFSVHLMADQILWESLALNKSPHHLFLNKHLALNEKANNETLTMIEAGSAFKLKVFNTNTLFKDEIIFNISTESDVFKLRFKSNDLKKTSFIEFETNSSLNQPNIIYFKSHFSSQIINQNRNLNKQIKCSKKGFSCGLGTGENTCEGIQLADVNERKIRKTLQIHIITQNQTNITLESNPLYLTEDEVISVKSSCL